MNCQLPVWRGQGEGFGIFARLMSRIFFRRFLGGELQLLGIAGLLCDGNASRTDTAYPVIPFPEPSGIGKAQGKEGSHRQQDAVVLPRGAGALSALALGFIPPASMNRRGAKTSLTVLLQVAVIQGAVPCSNSNQNQSP